MCDPDYAYVIKVGLISIFRKVNKTPYEVFKLCSGECFGDEVDPQTGELLHRPSYQAITYQPSVLLMVRKSDLYAYVDHIAVY